MLKPTVTPALFVVLFVVFLLILSIHAIRRARRERFRGAYDRLVKIEQVSPIREWTIGTFFELDSLGIRIRLPKVPEHHSEDCTRHQLYTFLRRTLWKIRYPRHCKTCEGAGGKLYHDPYAGDEFVLCHCTEAGTCPRCGHRHQKTPIYGRMGDSLWEIGKSLRGFRYYMDKSPRNRFGNWLQRKGAVLISHAGIPDSWYEETPPCEECNWNWGKNPDDSCLEPFEGPCSCEIEEFPEPGVISGVS